VRGLIRALRVRPLNRAKGVEPASDAEALSYGKEVKHVGFFSLVWDLLSIFK